MDKQFKQRGFHNGNVLLSKSEQEVFKDFPRKFDYKAYFEMEEPINNKIDDET